MTAILPDVLLYVCDTQAECCDTLHADRIQVRIARAKALLLSGLPLAQVAVETGF